MVARTERGGISTHIQDLVNGLADRVEFGLAYGEESYLSDVLRKRGDFVAHVDGLAREPNPLKDTRALLALRRVIRCWSPDIVHAHSFKAGFVGRLAAWLQGVPSLYTPHGFPFMPGAPMHWQLISVPLQCALARVTRAVTCVSLFELDLAMRRLGAPGGRVRAVLIYNGLPDVVERASPGSETQEVGIVSVGRFAEQKMQEDILRALAGIRAGYRLIVVGDGPTRARAEGVAASLGMRRQVEFAGLRDDVSQVLSRADIFLLASRWENLPHIVQEAMRAGLPIVATNVGGMAEAVGDAYWSELASGHLW